MADAEQKFSRDDIRAEILNSKGEVRLVPFGKVQVEIRTPDLEDLLQYRNMEDDDLAMARAIINNVYVPGTDERVFDNTDAEVLMKAKFTKDMKALNKAIMEVLGADDLLVKAVEDDTKSNPE